MRLKVFLVILFACYLSQAQTKARLLILGSDHLAQVYKEGKPNTDVLGKKAQSDLSSFVTLIGKYHPDAIMIEELPDAQSKIDSLYKSFLTDNSPIKERSEIFQIAFPLAKKSNLKKLICVNAPGGTSQSILDNGENIELYKQETAELRKIVGAKYQAIEKGELGFREFLIFLNKPATYNLIYHLRYITPARVTNGSFKNADEMVDTAFIDQHYIGAELTSIFKNRDYKIYSNMVNASLREKPKRILLLIGVAHIGSLKNIFRDDPEFELEDAGKYLAPSMPARP